jgi:hypothetical protein
MMPVGKVNGECENQRRADNQRNLKSNHPQKSHTLEVA